MYATAMGRSVRDRSDVRRAHRALRHLGDGRWGRSAGPERGGAGGLHLEDLHLVPLGEFELGCTVAGPHLHVLRREDNENKALVKCTLQARWSLPSATKASTSSVGFPTQQTQSSRSPHRKSRTVVSTVEKTCAASSPADRPSAGVADHWRPGLSIH